MFRELDIHGPSGTLAVCCNQDDGSRKILLYDIATKRQIGEVSHTYIPQGPRFSPDGQHLAFFGDGMLYAYHLGTRTVELLFHETELHASFCEWSHDGACLVFNAYTIRQNVRIPSDIYCLDIKSKKIQALTGSEAHDRFPQWSSDGKSVAFHRQFLDVPNPPKQIVILDRDTLSSTALIKQENASHEMYKFGWSSDSTRILVKELVDAHPPRLKVIRLHDEAILWQTEANDLMGGVFLPTEDHLLCISRKELILLSLEDGVIMDRLEVAGLGPIAETFRGPALYVDDRQVFFVGDQGQRVYQWEFHGPCRSIAEVESPESLNVKREEGTFACRDGRRIPLIRLIPPNLRELAVEFVFGGSANEQDPVVRQLVRAGYEVVCPVYRGLGGYGAEHRDAVIGEMGRADVWDIIDCGRDWKQVNPSRSLALVGISYGGFLTWLGLAGSPDLWSCGITVSGMTGLDRMSTLDHKKYPSDLKEKAAALEERSPLAQAKHIRVPLLMFHGGRDTTSTDEDVHRIQEFLHSNHVPCEVVIYPDDTHGLTRHRPEMFSDMLEFLDIYDRI